MYFLRKITKPLQNCIGPTIRIRRESWCLPCAGFFIFHMDIPDSPYILLRILLKPGIKLETIELVLAQFTGSNIIYLFCHISVINW